MRLTNDIIKDSAAFVKRRAQFLSAVFLKPAFPGRLGRPAPVYRGGHTGRTPLLGLLFRAHFLTLCCYLRHNSAAAPPLNVVIRDTFFPLPDWSAAHSLPPRCCYPAHNFIQPFPSGFPRQSCYPAHILQLCSALPGVVIQHTFYT